MNVSLVLLRRCSLLNPIKCITALPTRHPLILGAISSYFSQLTPSCFTSLFPEPPPPWTGSPPPLRLMEATGANVCKLRLFSACSATTLEQ